MQGSHHSGRCHTDPPDSPTHAEMARPTHMHTGVLVLGEGQNKVQGDCLRGPALSNPSLLTNWLHYSGQRGPVLSLSFPIYKGAASCLHSPPSALWNSGRGHPCGKVGWGRVLDHPPHARSHSHPPGSAGTGCGEGPRRASQLRVPFSFHANPRGREKKNPEIVSAKGLEVVWSEELPEHTRCSGHTEHPGPTTGPCVHSTDWLRKPKGQGDSKATAGGSGELGQSQHGGEEVTLIVCGGHSSPVAQPHAASREGLAQPVARQGPMG